MVRLNMSRLQHGCIFLQTKNREIEGKIVPYTFLNVIEVTLEKVISPSLIPQDFSRIYIYTHVRFHHSKKYKYIEST